MKPLIPPMLRNMLFLVLLALPSCAIHSEPGENRQSPARPKPQKTVTEPASPACRIPEGLVPSTDRLRMPGVVTSSADVVTDSIGGGVTLAKDGRVSIQAEVRLKNRGPAQAGAIVGTAFRFSGVAMDRLPVRDVSVSSSIAGAAPVHCLRQGPTDAQEPHVDAAHYVEIALKPGEEAVVQVAYETAAFQAEGPATLFGYRDLALENLKNYPWSYVSSPEYARIRAHARPFFGSITLVRADHVRVIIRSETGDTWMRGMSQEQNAEVLRMRGTYQWDFTRDDVPGQVGFEYLPSLLIDDEITIFKQIVKARPDDLRGLIRLSDLERFGGDPTERTETLTRLLAIWDRNAGTQLLTGPNDVRPAAHVALVKTLKLLGRDAESRKAATHGVDAVRALAGNPAERNASLGLLALRYLEKMQK